MNLTPEETFVINHIRTLPYGHVSVFVQNGVPIRIEKTTESILITVKPVSLSKQ